MTFIGIFAGIILLSLIMIIHECGHYFAGKAMGFKIEQFSLFMGPVLWEKEKNGVKFNIKLIPIGASVSFAGEASEIEGSVGIEYEPHDPGLFMNKPKWQRAIVVFMGPFINLLSAFLGFVLLFSVIGTTLPTIHQIRENSIVAKVPAIKPGDRIVSYNGYSVHTSIDLSIAAMRVKQDDSFALKVQHQDGTFEEFELSTAYRENRKVIGINYEMQNGRAVVINVDENSNNGKPVIKAKDVIISVDGIDFTDQNKVSQHISTATQPLKIKLYRQDILMELETTPITVKQPLPLGIELTFSKNFADSLSQAWFYPISIIKSTFVGLGMMFGGEIAVRDSLSGPVGIVSMISTSVKQSRSFAEALSYLLMLFGLLSVAVGLINLFPIPPMDGSHLLILAIEGITRRSLPVKAKEIISTIGFVFFLLMFIFVLYLDTSRLLGF